MELTLKGTLWDWTVGGTAEFFGTDGWVWQTFTAQGALGPLNSEWTFLFGPLAPAFLYAYGKYSLLLSGMDLVVHTAMVGPNGPYVFTGGPSGGTVLEAGLKLDGIKFAAEIGLGARKQDFTLLYSGVGTYAKVFPIDPFPGGLEFRYLKLGAEAIPLCCGITLDLGFAFVKEGGFDALTATLKDIPLCCGISFDVEVTFTTTAKAVAVKPKWAGIEGCLTVYGDVGFTGSIWQALELYGFKIRCDLGDCTYAEFLTAFNVAKIKEILGADVFQGAEYEYVKLGFCGPGCCGANWTLGIGLLFANFTVNLGLSAVVGGQAGLTVGWTLAF